MSDDIDTFIAKLHTFAAELTEDERRMLAALIDDDEVAGLGFDTEWTTKVLEATTLRPRLITGFHGPPGTGKSVVASSSDDRS